MSFFLGGGNKKIKPQYTGLQVQTSSSTMAITLLWGLNRIAPNIIWYGDFKSHKQKEKAGKGMGGTATSYTYSASLILALCQGAIHDVFRTFRNQEKTSDFTSMGFSLFLGETGQAPWGYLTSTHPDEALSYSGVAYLAAANYDLGPSATTPQHSFEVGGLRYNTGPLSNGDADCAEVVNDLLTSPAFGAGFPESAIDSDQLWSSEDAPTSGDGSYQTYCRARGFGFSPALSSQEVAGSILDRWAQLTDTAVVWTGYSLKLIPYGTRELTAHGFHFVPNLTPVYSLTDSDYISSKGSAPVTVSRTDPADANNTLKLTIKNRANEYNDVPVEWKDQGLIDLAGQTRPGSSIEAPEICTMEMGALVVSLIGQRLAYSRNTYEFKLPPEYCLLEPMDIVVVNDPLLGVTSIWIEDLEEDEDYNWKVTGKEIPPGIAHAFVPQDISNDPINTGEDPGPVNTPVIFQPPLELTGGVQQVWAAVSGGDDDDEFNPVWGGANVYVSTDATSYQQIGQVTDPSRQGKLTANLSSYGGTNPDTSNTLSVDLGISGGELQSVNSDEAARAATLSLVGNELLSFQDAILSSPYSYDLDTLYRGLYGTVPATHSTGDSFIRVDESIFKYNLPAEYVGLPLYFKFQSFNIWGSGVQDLADCLEYSYTPLGYSVQPPPLVELTFLYRVQFDGTFFIRGSVEISPSSTYSVDRYDVQLTTDAGVTWDNISSISSGNTLTYFEPATPTTDYQVRVRTVSGNSYSVWEYSTIVNSGSATDATVPDSPTSIDASDDAYYVINVSWVAPVGGSIVRSYKLFGGVGSSLPFGSCSEIVTLGSTTTNYAHSGVTPDEEWTYYVVACNLAGNSVEDGPTSGMAVGTL